MGEIEIDIYEQRLMEAIKKLHECQNSKDLESCLSCKEILECKVRDAYVEAVYKSMSKGEEGGFEF